MLLRILVLLCFVSFGAAAQTTTVIIDSTTGESVPYVNISYMGKGMSAEKNGRFTLPEIDSTEKIYFSAVGYADMELLRKDLNDTVYLHQNTTVLETLVINSRKQTRTKVVTPLRKAKNTWMGAGGGMDGSLLHAVYFPFKEEYTATPFVDKIRLKVEASQTNTFNLRLYAADDNSKPGNYLVDENILITVTPKQKYAETNLSKFSVQIPEEGLFVVVEFIAITGNRLGKVEPNEKYPAHMYAYGPLIMAERSDEAVGWSYKNGAWVQNKATEKGHPRMAIELSLTD